MEELEGSSGQGCPGAIMAQALPDAQDGPGVRPGRAGGRWQVTW